MFFIAIFQALQWIFFVFSIRSENGLSILHYVSFATVFDNIYAYFLSKKILGRKLNSGHLIALLIGIFGIFLGEFILYDDPKKYENV